jgi:predicted glycogen debranching enzyme
MLFEQPFIEFGREICGDLPAALRREWLVTNGLGGYASATVPGTLTRSYHGLLVAALDPPVERTVLVASLDEWLIYDGVRFPLCTHEFASVGITPDGYRFLESFRLDGTLPVWTFAVADAVVERRVWMTYGENTTYVQYRLVRGSATAELEITPLTSYRSFHALQSGRDLRVEVETGEQSVVTRFEGAGTPLVVSSDRGVFERKDLWWWDFNFRAETSRGLVDRGDLFALGTFRASLSEESPVALVASTKLDIEPDPTGALENERARQMSLIRNAGVATGTPLVQQLVLAADQFIVARELPDNPKGESIIAGYHWFNDWGRDTMISLPGLSLSTGRIGEAQSILRTFSAYIDHGLLPNNVPDRAGVIPGYNTADATLWYVIAIYRYFLETGDRQFVDDLLPTLRNIVRQHLDGTLYHIGVDPADGLLRAGEPGVQLTWMDAKVDDWVVTPRIGKPVEINALWYNVLRILDELDAEEAPDAGPIAYGRMAAEVHHLFSTRFVAENVDHLADVVDGPDGDDWSIRPNQIFSLSLPFALLEGERARRVLDVTARRLLTSYGLRSLTPDDPAYIGAYGGGQVQRDGAYHQGTVWSWLLGPFAEAAFRLDGDRQSALALLRPIEDHLRDAGLGSISEIFDGDAPHLPRGCIAQAWSVAETLRVLRMLESSSPIDQPNT